MVDAIQKQLPSRNEGSLALDWWTSMNKFAIMSVNACNMDQDSALREVRLAFDEVHSLFFAYSESKFRIIGQG